MTRRIPLSVVMPAYNEALCIERAVREVATHVLAHLPGAELIVVNDGSRDATGELLDRLVPDVPGLRVVHQPNQGHGPALRTGLDEARGDHLLLLDSDCQIPLTPFAALWETARHHDGVFGVRTPRRDPPGRLLLSYLMKAALRVLFGFWLHDPNAPFKLIRRALWLEARPYIPPGTLTPSLFLAIYARHSRRSVLEVAVPHRPRPTGVSTIRNWKLIRFSARAFGELLDFRKRLTAA